MSGSVPLPILGESGSVDERPTREAFTALPRGELVERYADAMSLFPRSLLSIEDDLLDRPFDERAGAGLWSVRIVIGHMADAEIAFLHRFRRTVGEEQPVLTGWDEDAFVSSGLYADAGGGADKPLAGFLAVIHTLRTFTSEWLGTLSEEGWNRTALHHRLGECTLYTQVAEAAWHLEHHAWYMHRKLEIIEQVRDGNADSPDASKGA